MALGGGFFRLKIRSSFASELDGVGISIFQLFSGYTFPTPALHA
jgi:hypothetical protein